MRLTRRGLAASWGVVGVYGYFRVHSILYGYFRKLQGVKDTNTALSVNLTFVAMVSYSHDFLTGCGVSAGRPGCSLIVSDVGLSVDRVRLCAAFLVALVAAGVLLIAII